MSLPSSTSSLPSITCPYEGHLGPYEGHLGPNARAMLTLIPKRASEIEASKARKAKPSDHSNAGETHSKAKATNPTARKGKTTQVEALRKNATHHKYTNNRRSQTECSNAWQNRQRKAKQVTSKH